MYLTGTSSTFCVFSQRGRTQQAVIQENIHFNEINDEGTRSVLMQAMMLTKPNRDHLILITQPYVLCNM